MPLGEFELIERYLSRLGAPRDDVLLGVGDDAALVRPPAGLELALAADTVGWRPVAVSGDGRRHVP